MLWLTAGWVIANRQNYTLQSKYHNDSKHVFVFCQGMQTSRFFTYLTNNINFFYNISIYTNFIFQLATYNMKYFSF